MTVLECKKEIIVNQDLKKRKNMELSPLVIPTCHQGITHSYSYLYLWLGNKIPGF